MFRITREMLKEKGACADGYRKYCEAFPEDTYPDGVEYQELLNACAENDRDDFAGWLLDAFVATDDVLEIYGDIPHVFSESEIDGNGFQSISIVVELPTINKNNLYQGGKFILFCINHIKQTVSAHRMTFNNGAPKTDAKPLKTWNNEILSSKECVSVVSNSLF